MPPYTPVAERLWSKICIKDSIQDCWLWTAGCNSKDGGYGAISNHCVMLSAHVLVYDLVFGDRLPHEIVCHTCDVRICCNPWHLFKGSYADNNTDKANKDRSVFGSNHWNVKLTEDQVIRILQCSEYGEVCDLANELGIHKETAYAIRSGKKWRRLWEKHKPTSARLRKL